MPGFEQGGGKKEVKGIEKFYLNRYAGVSDWILAQEGVTDEDQRGGSGAGEAGYSKQLPVRQT